MRHNNNRAIRWGAALAAGLAALTIGALAWADELGKVVVESTPPGAEVVVNGRTVGNTPMTLQLSTEESVKVIVKKGGYKASQFNITPSPDKAKRVKVTLKAQ